VDRSAAIPYRLGEPQWERFFDRIVARLSPSTVMDAGCAIGFLVTALRGRHIDARGIDTSEWPIGQPPPDVREYCHVGSVAESFDRVYDLITCIEVLEHLSSADAAAAIDNFCGHARLILFSSTPDDFEEMSHVTVRPADCWAALFAAHGFCLDFDFDGSFLTPTPSSFGRQPTLGR